MAPFLKALFLGTILVLDSFHTNSHCFFTAPVNLNFEIIVCTDLASVLLSDLMASNLFRPSDLVETSTLVSFCS